MKPDHALDAEKTMTLAKKYSSTTTTMTSTNPCFAGTKATVFSLDVDDYVDFYYTQYLYGLILCPWFLPLSLSVLPCERQNIVDRARATQVGVSKTHLIYCKEKVRTCWRCSICDEGKIVREIPLNKITDVIVEEPAGGCCPQNILYHVRIETPGITGPKNIPEIVISGLSKDDAYKLRSLVMGRRRTTNTMRRV